LNFHILSDSFVFIAKSNSAGVSVEQQITRKKKSNFREITEAVVVAVILAFIIRAFVVQAYKIPSGSMKPTLQIGDYLLVNKFIYGVKAPFTGSTLIPVKQPVPGDIIVFKYPKDPKLDYIKRVIAVAGDRVEIRNKQVFVNGKAIEDPHAHYSSGAVEPAAFSRRDNMPPLSVPDGHLFVLGDNRDNSRDSRFWGFVPLQDIRGKALIIYWSWDVQKPLLSIERFTSIRLGRFGDLVH
jgi:signal peptidase I